MLKVYLMGAFFIAHPFILRISNHGGGARIGKDSFLLAIIPLLFLASDSFSFNIPKRIKGIVLGFACVAWLNQWDFLINPVFYQTAFFMIGLVFYLLLYKSFSYQELIKLERFILIGTTLQVTFMLLEAAGLNPNHLYAKYIVGADVKTLHANRVGGPLIHGNQTGAYMAILVPIALKKHNLIFLPALILGLAFSDSALPVATAIGGAAYYFWRQKNLNKHLPFLMAILGMIIFYYFDFGHIDSGRKYFWRHVFNSHDFNLLYGHGLGYFQHAFSSVRIQGQYFLQEHNEYLATLIAFGLPGLGALLLLFRESLSDSATYSAALFGIFINFYGNFTLHISAVACLVIFIFTVNQKNKGLAE